MESQIRSFKQYFSSTKKGDLDFWTQYLTKVFSRQDFTNFKAPEKSLFVESAYQVLSKMAAKSAIQKMKNFNEPGYDEITNEEIKLIEYRQPDLSDLIHSLILCI